MFVDANPGRTLADAIRVSGMEPKLAWPNMAPPPPPLRMPGPDLPARRGNAAILHRVLGGMQQPPTDTSLPGSPPANMPGDNGPTPIRPVAPRADYAAMLREALGPRPELKGFRKVAAILGPALMAAGGNAAGAAAMIDDLRRPGDDYDRLMRQGTLEAIKWRREDEQAEAKRNEPQYFDGKTDRVRYDPVQGVAKRIYDAPEPFEDYAAAQGLEPGTPEWADAVDDYVLRSNGPTAFRYDEDLETIRQANRIALEGARQTNRLAVRSAPTYRDRNPRTQAVSGTNSPKSIAAVVAPLVAKAARGERLTPAEQGVVDRYGAPRRAAGGSKEQTATDPKTGRKAVWRGGRWVDVTTGRPLS